MASLPAQQHPPPPPGVAERNKYQSPPPPPSSMTPPPSSRAPQLSYSHARTPTPTHSHLSSPPPTVKTPPHQVAAEPDSPARTSDDLSNASTEHLRLMLSNATAECRAAKASAAHHRLQYELLSLEFSEAIKRFDVELEMAQKEVEVLQQSHSQAQLKIETPQSVASAATTSFGLSDNTVLEIKNHNRLLEIDNESLRCRLADAKALILEREALLSDENERLRRRIRENRQHFNHIRRNGSILSAKSPSALYQTPHAGPLRHGHDAQLASPSKSRGVEMLLSADQALSQEAATTPSTPINRPSKRHQASHVRGPHSMSSLPSTPYRSAPVGATATASYHAQPQLALSPTHETPSSRHLQQRRQSRDSTISASDVEEGALQEQDPDRVLDSEDEGRVTSPSLSDDHGHEAHVSQASQEAANMLRKSASFTRQQQTPTRHNTSNATRASVSESAIAAKRKDGAAAGSDTVQSKIYGYQVTKPGQTAAIKKRFYNYGDESPRESKKAKLDPGALDREGVGLGIGGWAGADR